MARRSAAGAGDCVSAQIAFWATKCGAPNQAPRPMPEACGRGAGFSLRQARLTPQNIGQPVWMPVMVLRWTVLPRVWPSGT